jgi:hypothetical protein
VHRSKTIPIPAPSDFTLENSGSFLLLRPFTGAAHLWVEENVSRYGFQPFWPVVLMEIRYAADVLHGIYAAGLSVNS